MDRRTADGVRRWVCGCLVALSAGGVWGQNANVTVNDQPTAEQRLAEVNTLRGAGRYDAAAEVVQELIDEARFKLVGVGAGRYTDAERWTHQALVRDGQLRSAYQQRYAASATRALGQAQAGDQPVAALREVYRRYAVTPAGFAAGLELSGRLLAVGDAAAAYALLDELADHPDRDGDRERLLMLRGAAAVYVGDDALREDVADQLTQLGRDDLARWLGALRGDVTDVAVSTGPGLIDAGDKPEELQIALWDRPLVESEGPSDWAQAAHVLPTVTPTLALINNGRQVVTLERASGQRLWVYPPEDAAAVRRQPASQVWVDQRGVGLGEGAVFAVLGACYGITDARRPSVPTNTLVGLDEVTGQPRWERVSSEVREGEPTMAGGGRIGRANLQHTHFVGTPIVTQGQVLVLVRRGNSQGVTQTNWLASFDAEDGSLRWFRHLALVSLSYSADSTKVSPQLTLVGETLYLSDGIATVGAIDVGTGGYRWLRVLPVGSGAGGQLRVATEGHITPPVMTRAGLLVPLALTTDRLLLLDPADGSTLRSFDNEPRLGGAQYLLGGGGDGALIVSLSSIAYWDARASEVAWSFPLDPAEKPTGRGDLTRRFAVVPTSGRVVVLDRATGRLLDEAPAVSGNLLVREGEVLATSEGRVASYTSWDRAYGRLVQRVKDHPEDPAAGLALASLALRQGGRDGAVVQGLDDTLRALALQSPGEAEAAHRRVFAQLRALANEPNAIGQPIRAVIFDRLALAAYSAEQEAAYHLDVGRYFASGGEPRRAVEHFHAVIADPAFVSQPYLSGGVTQSAGAVAQREMAGLIERHGRAIYSRYEALARARLAALRTGDAADPAQLAAVARRYPLSTAAADALLEAGRSLELAGRDIAAVAMYQQAVTRAGQRNQRRDAVGQLLAFYLAHDKPEQARRLLDRMAREHPDLYPTDRGRPTSPRAWAQRIDAAQPPARTRADLADDFAQPFFLDGVLIRPFDDAMPPRASRRLLLSHADGTVTCHRPDNARASIWRAQIGRPGDRFRLLADDPEQVVLWSDNARTLTALDPESGAVLWSTRIGFSTGAGSPQPRRPADAPTPVLITVSDAVICVADRASAQVVGIDRAGGRVLWRTTLGMTELTALSADHWTLAAAGRVGHPEELNRGSAALLDLFTGEPTLSTGELPIELVPFGIHLSADRMLLVGPSKVLAVDRWTGGKRWTHALSQTKLSGVWAIAGDLLVVEDEAGMIHALDAGQGGRKIGRAHARGRMDDADVAMQATDDAVWVRRLSGISCIGPSPLVRWQDALRGERLRAYRLLVGERRVALIASVNGRADPDRIAVPGRPESYGLFVFDRLGGRLLARHTLGPIPGQVDPRGAVLLGRGLAVPVGPRTLIVPGASAAPGE